MEPLQMGTSQSDNSNTDVSASTGSEVYNGYLNNIPEQDRNIVAKYAKDWDGNVTRKIQEIHESYKPYKDLGDIEDIQKALTFYTRFDEMPLEVYKLFKESLQQEYGDDFESQIWKNEEMSDEYEYVDEYGNPVDPSELDQYEVVEEPNNDVQALLDQYGTTLQEIVDWKNAQVSREQQEAENRQLDEHLSNLHNTYLQGYKLDEDDKDFLLIQLAKEKTPEQAAEAWKKKFGGQQSRPVPRVLPGQGGVGNDQVDLAKLRGNDRTNMVAQLLEARKQL